MKLTVRDITIGGLMIALSVILSQPFLKVAGSIGFDAIPAFFSAAAITPVVGGLVGALAHLISALFTGFPFSLPVHLVVAIMMFITCFAYGYTRKVYNRYIAVLVGIIMNGPISLLAAAFMSLAIGLPFAGITMFTALVGPLTMVAAINVILGEVLVTFVGSKVRAQA